MISGADILKASILIVDDQVADVLFWSKRCEAPAFFPSRPP